jgi:hypothetical protein
MSEYDPFPREPQTFIRFYQKTRGDLIKHCHMLERGGAPTLAAASWRKFSRQGMSWFTESFELRISSKQRLCSTKCVSVEMPTFCDPHAELAASPASKLASRRSKVFHGRCEFQDGVADRRGIHACLTQHNAGRAQG